MISILCRRGLCAWVILLVVSAQGIAGEPPALLLAETYRAGIDPRLYLVSEKLDGVLGYWDGRRMWTRGGNAIQVPSWFAAALPSRPLDGELWMGRERFEEALAAVRRDVPDETEWRKMRYMVFELPGGAGSFAERAQVLREIAAAARAPWLQAVEQFRVASDAALQKKLREVVKAGGEGLMLHRADAPYVTGRSDVLLKLKAWHDGEAVVIGHAPGHGRLAGMLGSLRVRAADGREFSLGTGFTDAQRRNPPPLGAVVTYRHHGLTSRGMPRFASFWRLRMAE